MKLQERLLAVESSSDELGGEIGTNSYRNPDGPEAAAQLDLYEAALREARDKFREYEKLHLAKVQAPDRGDLLDIRDKRNAGFEAKAARNREMADKIDAALNSTDTGA